jgi:phospholipid/cholesterol/gamma-HCH transport system substrate-binding protein
VTLTAANVNRHWIGTDAEALLGDRLGTPTLVLNDADAAGLAEMRFGAGRDRKGTVVMITLGTGIGCGMFHDGMLVANTGEVPTLVADSGAGQGMSQAARDALRKVDSVLTENSGALKDTIANFKVFSEGLARNTGKLDGIVAGLERMTGVTAPPVKITYDLSALQSQGPAGKTINAQWAIPEPTAVAMLETQRFLFSPAQDYPGFAEAMWADSLPKLLQARLIESFENYDLAHAPLRMADAGQTEFQLVIDVRRFRIAVDTKPVAEIALSARIVDKSGKVVASRLFEESEKFDQVAPPAAVAAFSEAFGRIAKNMIAWTMAAL